MKKKGILLTVNYMNWAVTEKLVKSLICFGDINLEIIIVDNSPYEDKKNLKELIVSGVTYLKSPENLGYFGAARYAYDLLELMNFDYLIICNNDIIIESEDFFNILNKKIVEYDVIAPLIKTKDGIMQNPFQISKISLMRKIYYKIYFTSFLIAKISNWIISLKKKKQNYMKAVYQLERNIFSPHGAFIIFAKSYFEKGGEIDAGYFLYGEEVSIAGQAVKYGLSIGYIPQLKILHLESITTGKGLSRAKYTYQKQATKYINEKYGLYKVF
jgi:GT2 family glycosyltransferase